MNEPNVIVLGLGGIGSAAAYWLSRRIGSQVLGIEQFGLGHERGGSEDHNRIIRMSYHSAHYVRLARHAYAAWDEVERDGGERLVLRTGGLDLAPATASIGLEDYRRSMTEVGIPFDELDARTIMARWPQWRLPDDVSGLYQEDSGIAMASRANAAHRRLAVGHGATLIDNSPVTSVREVDDEVEVVAGGNAYRARSLVVAAGAWTNKALEGLGVSFPVEVTLEQVVYVRPKTSDAFEASRFPVWIWMDEPCFYGFPIFGEEAVKIGWDRCAIATSAEERPLGPDDHTTATMHDFLALRLPEAAGEVLTAKTCLYTLTPDRDFVLGRVPGTDHCWVAVGAGHAFKFASVLGRILADLALDERTDVDIGPFAADRAVLTEANPRRSYMV